jgi:DHA1 family tetracycline resistance protein-like MFS transporter
VAIGRLAKRFPESRLILVSTAILAASLLAWALASSVLVLLILAIPLAFASGVLNTVINSSLTKSVYPEEVGGALGVSASVESLTRVIGPVAGAFLLDVLAPWAPGVLGALIMVWLVNYVWRRIVTNPDPPLPGRGEEVPGGVALQAEV